MTPVSKHGVYRGFRRSTGIGALPGSIERGADPISEKCRLTRISYNAALAEEEVIDNYFPIIEEIGDRLNAIDEKLEFGFDPGQRLTIRDVRADLLLLRRTVWPQREAIAVLLRDDCPLISDMTRTYLRDCYDHTIQLMDVIETYRELCADLRDFHLAEISLRSNEVMKTLTMIATLFMPLSFIAGFYGMNFHFMPELRSCLRIPSDRRCHDHHWQPFSGLVPAKRLDLTQRGTDQRLKSRVDIPMYALPSNIATTSVATHPAA